MAQQRTPNVLVLGVGGLVGEAWMTGLLAGLEARTDIDFTRAERYVGTSAGSMVAAALAGGVKPRRPAPSTQNEQQPQPSPKQRSHRLSDLGRSIAERSYAPASAALAAITPGAALLRAALLAAIPAGGYSLAKLSDHIARFGTSFDGRLRIVAVDRARGRRVVFGSASAPETTVAQAVAASCAVPGLYAPVTIGGRSYVDGGIWSPSNLDAADAADGDHILCLLPTGLTSHSKSTLIRGLGTALHSRTSLEIANARRHGANVALITPDGPAARAMGPNLLDGGTVPASLAEGFRQGADAASTWNFA
jgi:NTE family protein